MKNNKLSSTVLLILLLLAILIFRETQYIVALSDKVAAMQIELATIRLQNDALNEKVAYGNTLVEELVTAKQKPTPVVSQPKVIPAPSIDLPTTIKTIPFIPLMMEKIKNAFSF